MKTWTMAAIVFLLLPTAVGATELGMFEPDLGQLDYRGRTSGSGGSGPIFLSFSFGEGIYYHYNCDYGCDTVTVAPADFELLAGYRLGRHWQLDLGVLWAMDYDHYGDRLTSMVGFRPGVRLLLPGLFKRIWYLRAAVPILFGVSGENEDVLIGFMFGVGLEIRFRVIGFFAEVNFSPYFVEVADSYYVIPTQGRVGVSFRF